jgi:uncharacterized protein YqgV (UPF0045/DUF77 family)
MDIGVEISLYPLTREFIPPIEDFIRRLNRDGALKVVTNSMSTQVFGPYDVVMGRLVRELHDTLTTTEKAVFVMKVLGPLAAA